MRLMPPQKGLLAMRFRLEMEILLTCFIRGDAAMRWMPETSPLRKPMVNRAFKPRLPKSREFRRPVTHPHRISPQLTN